MANIVDAILALDAKAKVKVVSEDYDKITWFDDNPNKITVDQIKTKKAELNKVDKANEYKMQRVKEYPRIEDQLDTIYHKGIDEWKKIIKTVKDKYPKE
jgi:hypothetical protein